MDRAELLQLARAGAEARLTELEREMEAIRRQFPDLANGARNGRGAMKTHRRRRRLSAAARKRISEAQKARWAKQRAQRARSRA